ncbi:MAG: HNH endonuclease [Acidobacteria bacterium]|nr:HNH endonuclease [Acidobacteriota bacterium]
MEEISKAREEQNKKEFEKASELKVQLDHLESQIRSCLPDCPSEFPLKLRGGDTRHYALYRDTVWSSSRNLTSEQWKKLIDRKLTHEQQEIDYASSEVNADSADGRRERISEAVRQEVWRRDQGKCARCGSRENLEFDHIIPVSKGGGNTARNLELLCETCNRKKRDHIE